jgi:hypothetical protein
VLSLEKQVIENGEHVNGLYVTKTNVLKVATNRAHAPPHHKISVDSWSTSAAASSQLEAVARTTVHELGHHLHLQAEYLAIGAGAGSEIGIAGNKIYQTIQQQWAKVTGPLNNDNGAAPTIYATTDRLEFWAESFTAYHFEPEYLRTQHPDLFKMVETVLALLGMQK